MLAFDPLYALLRISLFHFSSPQWCQAAESNGESTSFICTFVEGVVSSGYAVIRYPLQRARFDITPRRGSQTGCHTV